ncbi:DUF3592 domain-containing protein [Actinomadura rifamycini]|uniref:DUF3592 domain-containing protein n=1 Tax=Actinomadura rifamycini TaxID=31962 RepID=UPI00146A7082|nr:DUF3592 domain-containing protein [Actinomadura rifamycini]
MFCLIGLGALFYAVDGLKGASALEERGRHATGTVVAAETERQGRADVRRIEVEFSTVDGAGHRFRTSGDTEVGGTVRVFYDPRAPGTTATTGSLTEYRWRHIAMLAFGVSFLLAPLLVIGFFAWVSRSPGSDAPRP